MTITATQVLKDALELAPVDRVEIIDRLFRSLDSSDDYGVDAAWSDEIESRFDAYENGNLIAFPAEEILASINQR